MGINANPQVPKCMKITSLVPSPIFNGLQYVSNIIKNNSAVNAKYIK